MLICHNIRKRLNNPQGADKQLNKYTKNTMLEQNLVKYDLVSMIKRSLINIISFKTA